MTRYESIEEMPPHLRKLVEKTLAKQNKQNNLVNQPTNVQTNIPTELAKPNKYHNNPTETMLSNGAIIKHKSKKEKAYFQNLLAMERAGVVRNIRLEQQFLITPSYTDAKTGEHFKSQSYMCDFVFEQLEDGKWVKHYVDTKGKKTQVYINKRKQMADKGIIIEEA